MSGILHQDRHAFFTLRWLGGKSPDLPGCHCMWMRFPSQLHDHVGYHPWWHHPARLATHQCKANWSNTTLNHCYCSHRLNTKFCWTCQTCYANHTFPNLLRLTRYSVCQYVYGWQVLNKWNLVQRSIMYIFPVILWWEWTCNDQWSVVHCTYWFKYGSSLVSNWRPSTKEYSALTLNHQTSCKGNTQTTKTCALKLW